MSKIKVAIVEDEKNYLYSLQKYLNSQEDIEVTITATNGKDALNLIVQDPPDVILMDINLSEDDIEGILLTEKLSKEYKLSSKIIMLTGLRSRSMIHDSIKAGAKKYVIKSDIEKIPSVIREAMEFCPDALIAEMFQNVNTLYNNLKNDYERERIIGQLRKLTRQQLMHLKLLLEGKTRNQISSSLQIEFTTVKNTINKMYKILNISERKDLFNNYCLECVDELLKEYAQKGKAK